MNKKLIRFLPVLAAAVLLVTCKPDVKEAEDREDLEAESGLSISCVPDDPDDTSATATGKIHATNLNENNKGTASEIEGESCDPTQSEQKSGQGQGNGSLRPFRPLQTTTSVADDPQPNTISEAFYLNPSGQPVAQLQDDYPATLPLPFTTSYLPASLVGYSGTCSPNTYLYALSYGDMSVKKIATCPPAAVKSITLPDNPVQVRITPDGTTAVVTGENNAVYFINTATDAVTTVPTSLFNPYGVAISPDGSKAYFTSYNTNAPDIFTVNISTHQVNSQALQVNTYPRSIFLTPDGSQAWVNFRNSSAIYIIDTASMSVATTVNTAGTADTGMAFSPDGTRAYIAIFGGSLAVYNTATLALVATIPVSDQPADVVVNKSGSRVYVTSRGGTAAVISIIDTKYNAVVGSFPGNAFGFTLAH
jgi:DNA-binding beta-propeller fold protein YncE